MRGCDRYFVPRPERAPIAAERDELIRRLLREWVSLRGIARATGVSRAWLPRFVNPLYRADTPHAPWRLKRRPAPS